uniref:peptidoglycan editing factor PgeF n=1 Tax=Candidatus Planktophila sp. TaxID=2175601 RepID=UPI00404AF5A5
MSYFFTDRTGGFSSGSFESLNFAGHVGDDLASVKANRSTLLNTQFMNQVHGDTVEVVSDYSDIDPTCDALVTTNPDVSLAVMVADCIPLLLISDSAVAAVHVGRAGLVNGITNKTLTVMRNLGARNIHAVLGPSICGKCYEVPIQLQAEVIAIHPDSYSITRQSTPALDLQAGLVAQFISQDVSFEASTVCTMENSLYFSHRRDNPTGRFVGVVKL